MSLGRYLLGSGELIAIVAALGFGAVRVRARLVPAWSGAPARLAEAVITASALLLVTELLGTAQLLRPLPSLVAGVAAGLAMARFGSSVSGRRDGAGAPTQMGAVATWLAVAVMLLVAVHWATAAEHSFSVGMYDGDENWYHLPFPARFAQEGSVTSLHYLSPDFLNWFYPLNGELFHALGMVAYHRDIVSPFLNLIWLALALLAAWCIGRPFRLAPLSATATALALDLPVSAGTQAGTAMTDIFGIAFLLAGVALLLCARGEGKDAEISPPGLSLAGLALGLSFGAKLDFPAPLVVMLAGVIAIAAPGRRKCYALLVGFPALATGAFWYTRNFLYALNPFPWVSSVGPIDLPGPNEGLNGGPGYSIGHYLTDWAFWTDDFARALRDQMGPVWFLLCGVALAGIALALTQRRDPLLVVLALVALVALLFYVTSPESAEGPEGAPRLTLRVLQPTVILGLLLAVLALARVDPRWRWPGLAACALLAVLGTGRAAVFWDGAGQLTGAVLIAGGLILLPIWVASMVERDPRGPLFAGLAVGAALLLAVGIGWPRTVRYLDHRYRTDDVPPLFTQLNLVPLYRWAAGIHDSRIGTSGVLQYGLYGEDLSNHVQYLGVTGADHSFRDAADCRSWREEVNDGRYDYVVAMPRFGGRRELQARWTRDPNARPVLHTAPITVFRVTGRLDPAVCGGFPRL